jgi:putative transposase
MKRTRRNHGATFKAQVALAAVKGDKTLAELTEQFRVHPTQITEWKQQLPARTADVFGGTKPTADTPDRKTLHAKIGQLALGNDFLAEALTKAGLAERKAMIDRTHPLPVWRQCQLLKLARSTAYYQPTPVSETVFALMRRIDELHLPYPFAGARMLRNLLRQEGHAIGRRHVATLVRRMGLEALYRKPSLSRRHPAHRVYPYLLRDLKMGFIYLFAVLDWASRRVFAWRLSNTLTTDFCLDAVQEAVVRYGTPEIFNTDQGCQFTSPEFTGLLTHHGIQTAWTGKGVGGTTCSSSDCGRASNTRRSVCTHTIPSRPRTRVWNAI